MRPVHLSKYGIEPDKLQEGNGLASMMYAPDTVA